MNQFLSKSGIYFFLPQRHKGTKKTVSRVFVSLWLNLIFFSGCEQLPIARQSDLDQLEQSIKDVRALQSEMSERVDGINSEVMTLSGRMDRLEFKERPGGEGDVSALKEDITKLKKKLPPPPIVPVSVLEEDERYSATLSPALSELFGKALDFIREGSFRDALKPLEEALDKSMEENKETSARVLFWSGVAYDGLGDTKRALTAYNEFAIRFPKHQRTPLALLRQASVFIRLGDSKTAKLALKKLIAEFPKSSEAEQAREKMKHIK